MLISLNWIKDFVEIPDMPAKELASKFTLATAEVEDVIVKGESLRAVKVVEIKSLKPHPDSDKLNLVTFDLGNGTTKEVVCGAPNVRPGLKVPYAAIGTTLPNGMTLEPKKIRGILSDGMLCSETELGLGEGKSGLMELPADAKVGISIVDHLKMESDTILDVDNKSLTHRPDLWGFLGLAREFAAAHGKPLKNRFSNDWEKKIEATFTKDPSPIKVEVSGDSSCLAYYGLSIDGIKMKPTPDAIKSRLETVGLRSINLVVDISNYVMIELGMPNHIFDREKIHGGKVIISKASKDLKFKTLDDVERDIVATDTIISDTERPLVLAGIMGGLESGVTDSTTKLFLEVANWEAPEVRKTSVRLGLRSDSSQRYEKTLDSNMCYRTLIRLVEMLKEHFPEAKIVGSPEKFVKADKLSQVVNLTITHKELANALGYQVEESRIKSIFESLDFKVNLKDGVFHVAVPTYRTTKDISCKADLVEEIGRMIGYDNIPSASPMLPVRPVRLSPTKIFHRKIQDFLVQNTKSLEIMTYPLVGKDLLEKALWPDLSEKLVLVNALSVEQDRMRPSIIPSVIEKAAQNQKQFDAFSFFEIGRSYLDYEKERSHLVIAMYSRENTRFVETENAVEKLLSTLNVSFNFAGESDKFPSAVLPKTWPGIHPHEFVNVQIMGKFTGAIFTVHPLILKNYKMKGHLTLAVIDITDLESREQKDKTKYQPISKFPSSFFDVTVVMGKDAPAAGVVTALNTLKVKEIKNKSLVSIFMIDETKKAVTIRTVFEDSEKTLTSETIKSLEQNVIQTLEKAGFPLRA